MQDTEINTYFEQLAKILQEKFPMNLDPYDLVTLGIFPSLASLHGSILGDRAPPYIKVGKKKKVFPRELLITWMKERMNKGR